MVKKLLNKLTKCDETNCYYNADRIVEELKLTNKYKVKTFRELLPLFELPEMFVYKIHIRFRNLIKNRPPRYAFNHAFCIIQYYDNDDFQFAVCDSWQFVHYTHCKIMTSREFSKWFSKFLAYTDNYSHDIYSLFEGDMYKHDYELLIAEGSKNVQKWSDIVPKSDDLEIGTLEFESDIFVYY
jgi:hypothetical protein